MEEEPQKIRQRAVFQIQGGTGVLSSSLPGVSSLQIWLQNFPLAGAGGALFFFLSPLEVKGSWGGEDGWEAQ